MIQGFGAPNLAVNSYKNSYAYQQKGKESGAVANGGESAKTAKTDEAVFSSKGMWAGKTNDEITKGVQNEYKKLQANIVSTMLNSAGLNGGNNNVDFDIDIEIPGEAQAMSVEDLVNAMPDEWKPDAVAGRIVDFAVAFYEKSGLSGEDFYEKIKASIEDGFGQADKAMGGKLPSNVNQVTELTRNAVLEKLNAWAESKGIQIPTDEKK